MRRLLGTAGGWGGRARGGGPRGEGTSGGRGGTAGGGGAGGRGSSRRRGEAWRDRPVWESAEVPRAGGLRESRPSGRGRPLEPCRRGTSLCPPQSGGWVAGPRGR